MSGRQPAKHHYGVALFLQQKHYLQWTRLSAAPFSADSFHYQGPSSLTSLESLDNTISSAGMFRVLLIFCLSCWTVAALSTSTRSKPSL